MVAECLSLSENAITVVQTTRTKFITSLKQHLDTIYNEEDSAYRFAALLLRLPAVIKCGAYKREVRCFNNPHLHLVSLFLDSHLH